MSRSDELVRLIETASSALEGDDRVEAAWLEGSFGAGTADEWSDIDLNMAVRDDAFDGVVAARHEILARLGPVMGYYEAALPDGFLACANLEGLRRIDLVLFRSSDVGRRPRPDVTVLFDRGGLIERLDRSAWPQDMTALVEAQVKGFFFGSFQPLRLWNRGEWGSLQMGWHMVLFQHVAPLWLSVDDPANAFRPHLHNERFLTRHRRERLDELLADAHGGLGNDLEWRRRVTAGVFELAFEALREACGRWGVAYPEASEASVRQVYREELGLRL